MDTIEVKQTGDGSPTILNTHLNETYHSTNGALTESRHIFIEQGYHAVPGKSRDMAILEVGFGTGLNALLTMVECEKDRRKVNYVGIEPYPLEDVILKQLNYPGLIGSCTERNSFFKMHHIPWEVPFYISDHFILYKIKQKLQDIDFQDGRFSLIYFDAFSPETQPEMWTQTLFSKLYSSLQPGGLLLTYSVKGDVRRNMQSAGFDVEKIPGPPGKREITRAQKPLFASTL